MTWPDTSAGEISWEHLYLVWLWQLESTIEQIQVLAWYLGHMFCYYLYIYGYLGLDMVIRMLGMFLRHLWNTAGWHFPTPNSRNCEVEGLFELHDHASLEPQQILWRLCLAQSYQEQTSVRMTRMTKSWAFHGVHTLPLPKADSLIRWIFWFISYSHGKWPIYRWFTY